MRVRDLATLTGNCPAVAGLWGTSWLLAPLSGPMGPATDDLPRTALPPDHGYGELMAAAGAGAQGAGAGKCLESLWAQMGPPPPTTPLVGRGDRPRPSSPRR